MDINELKHIEHLRDSIYLPESDVSKIVDLLLTDDENNWELVYQLYKGLYNNDVLAGIYFHNALTGYMTVLNINREWKMMMVVKEYKDKLDGN